MAKIYGARWELINELGAGGQGTVFRVRDLRGEFEGEYALKRLTNPKRHGRFRNEIAATKRLSHEHIVRVIDHSALDIEEAALDEKSYLVMPIAAGGDLSKRAPAFKSSLDATIAVAQRLASALSAAHDAEVVHRDVKPENILFQDSGNETVLLSDFGICLLRDADERITDASEAVGPRLFMAPELEGGRLLDVSPAADVYSLGKVIYYMITGGIRLPREQFTSEMGADVFKHSERFGLLKLLLERMIAPLDRRIASMREVEKQLQTIADWELRASTTSLSQSTRKSIDSFRQLSADNERQMRENIEAIEIARRRNTDIVNSVYACLEGELKSVADMMAAGESLKPEVRNATVKPTQAINMQGGFAVAQAGVELSVAATDTFGQRRHQLFFWICSLSRTMVHVGGASNTVQPLPANDQQFIVIPSYRLGDNQQPAVFFDATPARGRSGMTKTFYPPTNMHGARQSLAKQLRASQWPMSAQELLDFMSSVIERFVILAQAGSLIVGP